jgi:hypothetical protein
MNLRWNIKQLIAVTRCEWCESIYLRESSALLWFPSRYVYVFDCAPLNVRALAQASPRMTSAASQQIQRSARNGTTRGKNKAEILLERNERLTVALCKKILTAVKQCHNLAPWRLQDRYKLRHLLFPLSRYKPTYLDHKFTRYTVELFGFLLSSYIVKWDILKSTFFGPDH